jgi:hypothetical protein
MDRQACQSGKHLAGTISSVLERMRLLVQPGHEGRRADAQAGLRSRCQMLDRVREVQDTHRI